MKRVLPAVPFLLLLAFPLIEVGAHVVTRAHVPSAADWRAAASFVRANLQPRDMIVAAPAWTDPLLRRELGDRIDLAMAGHSDTAGYDRLWALSIRGARPREAPAGAPVLDRGFGRVHAQRWQLAPSSVVYDFTQRMRDARVDVSERGQARQCKPHRFPEPRGGGLGFGVLPPSERIACEGGRQHGLWLAAVVMEDLELTPRYCVFQSKATSEPLRISFANATLAQRIVFYGGLYYEHERMREGGPVLARVLIDGREVGRMLHHDGDGWKRLALATTAGHADVAFEISASREERRGFCWAASVRADPASTARGAR